MRSLREISAWFTARCSDRKGVTMVEYALLLVLVAFLVWFMVEGLGGSTGNKFSAMNSRFSSK